MCEAVIDVLVGQVLLERLSDPLEPPHLVYRLAFSALSGKMAQLATLKTTL